MTAMRLLLSLVICSCLVSIGAAQSTSNPILIESKPSSCTPSQGSCYVTITFEGGSVNQHENWYTSFISHSKKGNLTISIDQQLESGPVSDSKSSDPVDLTKNGSDLHISYEGPIVLTTPLTFTSISLKFN